jgi:hypothetical protein
VERSTVKDLLSDRSVGRLHSQRMRFAYFNVTDFGVRPLVRITLGAMLCCPV